MIDVMRSSAATAVELIRLFVSPEILQFVIFYLSRSISMYLPKDTALDKVRKLDVM